MKGIVLVVLCGLASLAFAPPLPPDIERDFAALRKVMAERKDLSEEYEDASEEEQEKILDKMEERLEADLDLALKLTTEVQEELGERDDPYSDEQQFDSVKLMAIGSAADCAYHILAREWAIQGYGTAENKPKDEDDWAAAHVAHTEALTEAFEKAVEEWKEL